MAKLVAEALGTFVLVLAGTGAIVLDGATGGRVTNAGIAFTFGFAVFAMIQAFGRVSGAHLNPAITLALAVAGRFPGRAVLPYVCAQCLGALAASALLAQGFPGHSTLGATLPRGSDLEAFGLELAMTGVLALVILTLARGPKERGLLVGIAAGAVVGLEAYFGGPISGASMNPARSLAPALLASRLDHLWIYLAAPTLGALAAIPACRAMHPQGCCFEGGG